MSTFTTIEEYINTFEGEKKDILTKLYQFLKETLPEAKETISYKMPTFKLNGNIIHFAMFKNHLGLYPGAETINYFQEELQNFKTSKGAIQIDLKQDLPFDLIKKIVQYNHDNLKDKKAPDWKKYHDQYAEITEKLEQIVNETELVKDFKWGGDIYTINGKNVLAFSGFKNHYALWFYQGVFLEDKDKVLISANEAKTKGLRQWRFKSIDDLDEKKVKAYIQEAIQNAKDGKEIKVEKSAPKAVDGILKVHLDSDSNLKSAFEALTPSKRKEYIEYIEEAKQEKTKLSRLEKIKPMIIEGKGLNDKYKK